MDFQKHRSSGNRAVALLATCFVVLGGALACAAIAVTADLQHLEATLAPLGGVLAAVLFLLWLLRERPPENRARVSWSWLGRRGKRKVAYRVKPRLAASERCSVRPAPPTADSIRAITGRQSTWVPVASVHRTSPGVDYDVK